MSKPAQQVSYQQNMRGVDQFDQHASYNSIDIKSKYPYMRIVLHLIEVAINNVYIIFSQHANENSKKKYSERLVFRKQVCRSLVDALRDQNGFVNSQRSQPLEEEPEKESFNSVSLLLILILVDLAGKIALRRENVNKRPNIGAQGVSYTTVRAAMLRLIRKLNASTRKNIRQAGEFSVLYSIVARQFTIGAVNVNFSCVVTILNYTKKERAVNL